MTLNIDDAPLRRPVDVDLFSELFNVHRITVRQQCANGSIPAVKVGARWCISRSYVEALLRGENPDQTDTADDTAVLLQKLVANASKLTEAQRKLVRRALKLDGPP
jgi:excisionase family DNA binding protein